MEWSFCKDCVNNRIRTRCSELHSFHNNYHSSNTKMYSSLYCYYYFIEIPVNKKVIFLSKDENSSSISKTFKAELFLHLQKCLKPSKDLFFKIGLLLWQSLCELKWQLNISNLIEYIYVILALPFSNPCLS